MDFLKNNRRFDFVYGGKPFAELSFETQQIEDGDTLTTVYALPDGLKITNIATKHGDAYEWVNWWENTSDQPTEILSQLWDAAIELPMPYEGPLPNVTTCAFEEYTAIYAPKGSTCDYDDFCFHPDIIQRFRSPSHILPGASKSFATSNGRSSEKHAPFFNVHKAGKGYIFAIGWTGQWNSYFERTAESIIVKAKIEDTHFYLLPGEKIRTASFVFVPYEGTARQGQVKWRRLAKKYYSCIGQDGQPQLAPISFAVNGFMASANVLDRIRIIREYELPIDYFWMDAGWYGKEEKPGLSTQSNWWACAGDWTVSPYIHPQGLKPISDAIHETGMKFLLWVDAERAGENTQIVAEHPEYFYPKVEGNDCFLLNLGDETAWQYCYDMLTTLFDTCGVDCYRQDFNWDPLADWRQNDTEDRQGISEIKHIMGLYRLWDALLDRYPELFIDNCASGGRRIDIETLRRSVPLFRSDYQCYRHFPAEGPQSQNFGYSTWVPYCGTGAGTPSDTYRFRSAYSPALQVNVLGNFDIHGEDAEKVAWLKGMIKEYLKVRPYMSEDFYPLTEVSSSKDVWCAAQYNRPEQNDGIVQVFRREKAPYSAAEFALYDLDCTANYIFTDADTGEKLSISGQTLMTQGLCVTMPERRSSKIYFYKKQ